MRRTARNRRHTARARAAAGNGRPRRSSQRAPRNRWRGGGDGPAQPVTRPENRAAAIVSARSDGMRQSSAPAPRPTPPSHDHDRDTRDAIDGTSHASLRRASACQTYARAASRRPAGSKCRQTSSEKEPRASRVVIAMPLARSSSTHAASYRASDRHQSARGLYTEIDRAMRARPRSVTSSRESSG